MDIDKMTLLHGLPYVADEARDMTHWHIRNSSGFPLLDINTSSLPPSAVAMVREFIVTACNSHHRREELLRKAMAALEQDELCRNADLVRETKMELLGITEQDIAESRPGADTWPSEDEKAQQAEVADDTAGAIEQLTMERDNLEIDLLDCETILARGIACSTQDCGSCTEPTEPLADGKKYLEQHGWKDGKPPEQLREFVTKHRQEKAEAEAAVKLLVDGWDITTSPDCREIDSVCDGCDKAEYCGPDTDTEPCDKWREAEARDDARAAARKVLERMKG